MDRSKNDCLSEFSLVEQSGYGVNRLRYVPKSDMAAGMDSQDGPSFFQTEKHLENFFALKQYY